MSDTNAVVSLYLTPHLSIDLSPLDAEIVTGKINIKPSGAHLDELTARLKPYASKVLAAIAACHGRTQAVVLSRAALCVLQCADLVYPNTSFMVMQATQGKAISLVPGRQGYCLVATGHPEGTLFGLTIMCEKDTHFFPINDDVANTKVAADIVSQLKAAQAQSVAAGEAAGVYAARENKETTMSTIDTDTKPLPPRSPDSRVMNPAEMSALFAACGAVYAEPVPMSEEDRRKSEDPDFLGVLNGVDIYRK